MLFMILVFKIALTCRATGEFEEVHERLPLGIAITSNFELSRHTQKRIEFHPFLGAQNAYFCSPDVIGFDILGQKNR